MSTKLAVFDAKPYDRQFFEQESKEKGIQIKFYTSKLSMDTVNLAKGYDAVSAFVNDDLSSPVIEELHKLGIRLIAMRCAGYNNVDLHAAKGKIPVVRVPAYSPYAVAEHAIALMMSLNRKIHRAYYRTRDNNFALSGFMGFDMHGKTAGILGTGKIGQIVIHILKGFGMKILAYDAYPNEEFAEKEGISYVDLDTLYENADIISLHCPLVKNTHHILGKEAFSKMKEGVMLINTSRGGLIDSKALIKALKYKKIGSAGLDVYEEEGDYFFEDHSDSVVDDDVLGRLLSFNNVLLTSHQAFFTQEALTNIAETTLENIEQFFVHNKLQNAICERCGG